MADNFAAAFAIAVGHEGGYSAEHDDPGNWTSGVIGQGSLRGTKFGISAAAYPILDISGLTLADAETIYRRDYWAHIQGDLLPAALSLLVFDAAVNNGVDRAARWLQIAVGAVPDGDIGPLTLQRLKTVAQSSGVTPIAIEFQARRTDYMAGLETWRSFGLGWARRLCALPYQSLTMGSP